MTPAPDDRAAALQARRDQIVAELAETRRQLAALEARLCTCHPHREHTDTQPARHLHTAGCPVTANAQAPMGEPA